MEGGARGREIGDAQTTSRAAAAQMPNTVYGSSSLCPVGIKYRQYDQRTDSLAWSSEGFYEWRTDL